MAKNVRKDSKNAFKVSSIRMGADLKFELESGFDPGTRGWSWRQSTATALPAAPPCHHATVRAHTSDDDERWRVRVAHTRGVHCARAPWPTRASTAVPDRRPRPCLPVCAVLSRICLHPFTLLTTPLSSSEVLHSLGARPRCVPAPTVRNCPGLNLGGEHKGHMCPSNRVCLAQRSTSVEFRRLGGARVEGRRGG